MCYRVEYEEYEECFEKRDTHIFPEEISNPQTKKIPLNITLQSMKGGGVGKREPKQENGQASSNRPAGCGLGWAKIRVGWGSPQGGQ